MDALLSKVTQHAMNYAIRSGITITTSYAIKQCGRLLKETPRNSKERAQLLQLQLRLDSKIKIISPAIDMIELIAARGNTSLESAVSLTREIRADIQALGTKLDQAANEEKLFKSRSRKAKSREEVDAQLRSLVSEIQGLLIRIEDAVPLINLAITTSGVNLSTSLSGTISPSRLLQASWFLAGADMSYSQSSGRRVTVGPTYTLSVYMLFAGHAREINDENLRNTTWKEVIHKARCKLVRLPLEGIYSRPGESPSDLNGAEGTYMRSDLPAEFAYQLLIIEDLDDDRVHTFEDDEPQPGPFEEVANAGIRDVIPIHEISKLFYADTGKILNIGGEGETNHPVLLLRRDVHAIPPRLMMSSPERRNFFDDSDEDEQSRPDNQKLRESTPGIPDAPAMTRTSSNSRWRLPADLDPEWIALEVYQEEVDEDDDDDESATSQSMGRPNHGRQSSSDPSLTGAMAQMSLRQPSASPLPSSKPDLSPSPLHLKLEAEQPIKTTLSLLEMLLKLTALQQFRQQSHLTIGDELLNFFLEDSATAGAGPNRSERRRLRHEAMTRVGFDPYDESPIKRRGEEYIQHLQPEGSPALSYTGYSNSNYRPPFDEAAAGNVLTSVEQPTYSREATPSSPSSRYQYPGPTYFPVARESLAQRLAGARSSSQPLNIATPPSSSRPRQAGSKVDPDKAQGYSPLSREIESGKAHSEGVAERG
ncbi:Ran-binding-domain-containing protein [Polychaeton citri CBS 116435]|uniref:Ran-binding-domain-containing protein n=1 Tax=Polychaeton citri CBS 116435 TaxID=1314669 RepID=A0A9P4QH49_9PEZI|nr:Ran-binding-domain-containing protein [Polychaeton citri CBS 116435]